MENEIFSDYIRFELFYPGDHRITDQFHFDKDYIPNPINRQGWKVLDERSSDNSCLSPLSLYQALGMLANGTEKRSKAEKRLLDYLSVPSVTALNDLILDIRSKMSGSDSDSCSSNLASLLLANSLENSSEDISPSYRKTISDVFGSDVWIEDFSDDELLQKVSGYISRATRGTIPDYSPSFSADDSLCLYDVVHFAGEWKYPFDQDSVEEYDFTDVRGVKHSVMMMFDEQKECIRYHSDGKYRGIELPYGSDDGFAMYLILPFDDKSDIASRWAGEDIRYREQFIDGIASADYWHNLSLGVPRFSLDNECDMTETLDSLGLKCLFSQGSGLNGILQSKEPQVSRVQQRVRIEVDEGGTKAAAVTEIYQKLGKPDVFCVSDYDEFICEVPFVFVLRHKPTGTNLFVGCYGRPEDQS